MANLFAKAASKTTPTTTKKKSETLWQLRATDPLDLERIESINKLADLHRQIKNLEAQETVHKTRLKQYAEEQYVKDFADRGVPPEAPMKLLDPKSGNSVTFVVQDRTGLSTVKDEQIEGLREVLGETADELVYEQMIFSFDPAVMAATAKDGRLVQDIVAEAISESLEKLVKKGALEAEQLDALLSCKQSRMFRPLILPRLAELCRRSIPDMRAVLDILASSVVRYVKC